MKLYRTRTFLCSLGVLLAFSFKFADGAGVAEIALYRGADRQARLEKGAKAEGEFVWYTSINAADIQEIVALFE